MLAQILQLPLQVDLGPELCFALLQLTQSLLCGFTVTDLLLYPRPDLLSSRIRILYDLGCFREPSDRKSVV